MLSALLNKFPPQPHPTLALDLRPPRPRPVLLAAERGQTAAADLQRRHSAQRRRGGAVAAAAADAAADALPAAVDELAKLVPALRPHPVGIGLAWRGIATADTTGDNDSPPAAAVTPRHAPETQTNHDDAAASAAVAEAEDDPRRSPPPQAREEAERRRLGPGEGGRPQPGPPRHVRPALPAAGEAAGAAADAPRVLAADAAARGGGVAAEGRGPPPAGAQVRRRAVQGARAPPEAARRLQEDPHRAEGSHVVREGALRDPRGEREREEGEGGGGKEAPEEAAQAGAAEVTGKQVQGRRAWRE